MTQKIYISGPMTGLPEYNYTAFNAEADRLRGLGYEVENPAENEPPACGTWEGWMQIALEQLAKCNTIYMLPGWSQSRGARIEYDHAKDQGMAIMGHVWEAQ